MGTEVKTVGRLHEPAKVWPLLSVRFPIKSDITLSDMNMEAMAIWVVEFSNGGTKLDRFLPKNQHYYWILRIGLMGRCKKMPKFEFQSQFSMSKCVPKSIFFNEKKWERFWYFLT